MLSFNAYTQHLQPVGYRPNQFQNTKDVFSFPFSDAYRNKALKQGWADSLMHNILQNSC